VAATHGPVNNEPEFESRTVVRAYRLIAPGRAEVVDVPEPIPGPGEALLRVLGAGVCRTDLGLVRSGANDLPVTLGHEIVGEVLEFGPNAEGPAVGTSVAVYERIGCGRCGPCRRGEDNLCRHDVPTVPGITRDGGMAELVVVPARNLIDIGGLDAPEAAPLTDAGMTAFHAVAHAQRWLRPDAAALVIGIGGLGHLAVQFVAATTQASIIAVDVDADRLEFAAKLGATHGVLSGPGAAEQVLEASGGVRLDVAIDFVGSQESLDLAAHTVARGGAIVVTGGGGGRLGIEAVVGAGRAPEREVSIVHTFGGSRTDLAEALRLAAAGHVHSRVQTYALEDTGTAMSDLAAGRLLGRAVIVPHT
jgi:propanol-preferring alcohol dehydrogenase